MLLSPKMLPPASVNCISMGIYAELGTEHFLCQIQSTLCFHMEVMLWLREVLCILELHSLKNCLVIKLLCSTSE